ncbi:MAG: diguanylate cyclase [Leptolyngbyaceae cyanobacterium MO_188.B28]|nr:diguanylate cyclase [Leptolyngbyaceae cyanobacterium MO_188.B28]
MADHLEEGDIFNIVGGQLFGARETSAISYTTAMTETPVHILVVDDQPDQLHVLSNLLMDWGCRVNQALTGKEALKIAKNEFPELILLAVNMPELDGYEVCSILKEMAATQELPVIFVKGADEPFDCDKAFRVGGADYVTKPFESSQVMARITHQLTIRRQHAKLQQANQARQEIEAKLENQAQEMQALLDVLPDFWVRSESDGAVARDCSPFEGAPPDLSLSLSMLLDKRIQKAEQSIHQRAQRERLLGKITQRIRQSLQLDEILNTAVEEVRCLLQTDRVVIYRFFPDWSGQIVNESVSADKFSILGEVMLDPCLEYHWSDAYLQGRISAVENIYAAKDLKPCYVEMLASVHVQAVLALPILQQETPDNVTLWGMLIAHHCIAPRLWRQWEIDLLKQLVAQLAIAIQHGEVYQKLQAANRELERLANLDGLTQIPNRRCFNGYFEQEWRRLKREKAPISLIMCDVDYFKSYNDYYGHLAGDDCLKQIAQILEQVIRRPADIAARYGGEEFAIVLPNTDLEGAIHIVQQIQTEIAELALPHANAPNHIVTFSLGIASLIPTFHSSPECLIAMADQALYIAKTKGRDTYCVYTDPVSIFSRKPRVGGRQ